MIWLPDEGEVQDAKREAAWDDAEARGEVATCQDCGEEWVLGVIAATRTDPADCASPVCPWCGGQPSG